MQLDLNWINLLILFGALQGFIFGIVLLFNKKHPGAKYLSAFMLALSYNGIETFNWSSGLSNYHSFFSLFAFILIFSLGPSLYLYVTAVLYPERRFSRLEILRLYSIVVFQFIVRVSIICFYILWVNTNIDSQITPADLDNYYVLISEPLSVMVFIFYVILSSRQLRNARKIKQGSKQKNDRQIVYQWITALLWCMLALSIAWTATVVAPMVFDFNDNRFYYPIEIGLVFFIYWIAFAGYYKTKIIYGEQSRETLSPISETEIIQAVDLLKDSMEKDKIYLNPELNLIKVSAHTKINTKTISFVLNQHLGKSFNEFINEYRIQEVQQRLLAPQNDHLTISGIALDSGFNSHATFQRAFKNVTGMSPREYVSEHLKNVG